MSHPFVECYDWNSVSTTHNSSPLSRAYRLQVDGAPCVLEILDTAGTEQFASMRDLYIKNGHGFIVMYSLTNHQTFQVSLVLCCTCRHLWSAAIRHPLTDILDDRWCRIVVPLQDISNMKNVISRVKGSQPAPILLVANKLDLECQREVSREEGKQTGPL